MKKYIILFIFFFSIVKAYATVTVMGYPSGSGVNVCTPSDKNSKCGGVTGGGLGTNGYARTFTNSDLVVGVLTVLHDLGAVVVESAVYDNGNNLVFPDSVTETDTNTLTVNLSSFGSIAGTWSVGVLPVGTTFPSESDLLLNSGGSLQLNSGGNLLLNH